MNTFNDTRLTTIALNLEQIRMANTIIQLRNIFTRNRSEVHRSLAKKIEQAKDRHFRVPPFVVVTEKFTDEEMKLMRDFNTEYCFTLGSKMEKIEELTGEVDRNGLEAYKIATAVQLKFSSFK